MDQRPSSLSVSRGLLDKRSSTVRAEITLVSAVPYDPAVLVWSWVALRSVYSSFTYAAEPLGAWDLYKEKNVGFPPLSSPTVQAVNFTTRYADIVQAGRRRCGTDFSHMCA